MEGSDNELEKTIVFEDFVEITKSWRLHTLYTTTARLSVMMACMPDSRMTQKWAWTIIQFATFSATRPNLSHAGPELEEQVDVGLIATTVRCCR